MRRIFRKEAFGYIVQPPLTKSLVYLATRKLNLQCPLSAPVEAHLSVTEYCPNQCPHCYEASTRQGSLRDLSHWKGVVDTLSSMGVFHLALGGGEPATVPWLFELAEYARLRGMVPNLTTSGILVDERWASRCEVFGQVNVSLDGPQGPRGLHLFDQAVRGARMLRRFRGDVGINCVITRQNFPHRDDICALARQLGLREVELLRYKPAGRAADANFDACDLTADMYASVVSTVRRLMLKHRLRIKLDCSMVPAVAMAGIQPGIMELFGASGCEGGNELCAVDASGFVRGCSFDSARECGSEQLRDIWEQSAAFSKFRKWQDQGSAACVRCDWFEICRGGCHVVAQHVTGSWYSPDPCCTIAKRKVDSDCA